MAIKLGSLALCAVFLGAGALAQERTTEMELAISDGQGEDIVIRINSKEQGFSLQDMQLGASHTLNTEDGRPVVVTRVDHGYSFDVDGRTISMPLMEHGESGEQHKELHIVRRVHGGPGGLKEGVTIISPTALDDTTRSTITSALAAAGQNDVRFINSDMMGRGPDSALAPLHPVSASDAEQVRIVRKEVHVTN